ncbi:cilia- and flagella-associated protein 61 [Ischnura elegans]|uniref:cilia- and flagella-associated protein 61 n=1 Tax=Ischnura elegans TaxID=197161 RepID=UPI001ED8AA5D|nr:cilia- and flagella-associated protein 61 [Ischnura elegans]
MDRVDPELNCQCYNFKSWRRNTLSDVPAIRNIIGHHSKEIFGEVNVAWLIERCQISISQLDSEEKIISHVALLNYPNISTVPPCGWMYWAKMFYRLSGMSHRNAVFIHHIAWHSKCSLTFLKPLIEIIFLNCVKTEYLLMVVPPGVALSEVFDDCFMKLLPQNEASSNVQTFYYCLRERYFPKLTIRMAVEEDHDDLTPIINGQNSKLRLLYGEYFVSDLISQPNEDRKILVAQGAKFAAGIMIITTKLDTKRLVKYFELAAFNGLCKPDKEDVIALKPFNIVSSLASLDPMPEISKMFLDDLPEDLFDEEEIVQGWHKVTREVVASGSPGKIGCLHDTSRRVESIYRELISEDLSAVMGNECTNEALEPASPLLHQGGESARFMDSEILLPTYAGKENAFCIELLAIDDKYDERQAEEFLHAAFEIFPEHDYCLISLPFNCPTFLLMKYFERVVPRCCRYFPHELYIMHRNSALSEIRVEQACQLDKDIIAFLSTIEFDKDILMDFLAAVTPEVTHTMAFVVISEECVIGVVIIQEEEDIAYIRSNYDIDKCMKFDLIAPEEHGQIVQMALSPIFQRHSRYVLREVLRLSGMACFYYKLYPEWAATEARQTNIMTAIGEMMPLYPRKTITHHLNSLSDIFPEDKMLKKQDPYALYIMTAKLSSQLSSSLNTRIVVVGASEIALSFLETLFFSATKELLTLNNVFIVSPYGLPSKSNNPIADKYFLENRFYNLERLAKISLFTWVNSVLGVMTKIDRKKKIIEVNGNSSLEYDYLIIACEKQFQDMLEIPQEVSQLRGYQQKKLTNSFSPDSHQDILDLLKYIRESVEENSSRKIIVYGYSLDAYITVAILIESGYGDYVILVEDFPQDGHALTCFNNDEVYNGVMSEISRNNVEILQKYHLDSWQVNDEKNEVVAATFTDNVLYRTAECYAFISCGKKCIDDTTFSAIGRSSLVLNKYIVIKPDFSTNDPCIYSAGPISRYEGRYYADEYRHEYFNAREVGSKLCQEIKNVWLPGFKNDKPKGIKEIIFGYKKPLVNSCKLPGGWNYFHVSKPGKQVPLNEAIHNDNYGRALTTGNCLSEEMGYFRIHLNPWNIVETITCYTKKVIDTNTIVKLYGKHDRLLNNLTKRHELGYIEDLYDHFSQSWITAIYHDRFSNFYTDLLKSFKQTVESEENPLSEMIRSLHRGKGYKKENEEIFKALKTLFKPSLPRRKVELQVLEFLSRNSQYFPMYLQLSNLEETMDQRKESPFHSTF